MSLPTVPPALGFLAAAAIAAGVDRRVGHAVGAVVATATLAWVFAVPAGAALPARLFGFDVVVVAVDPFSRAAGGVFAFVALADVAYSYGTGASGRETATALAYVGASLGAVFAGDWLTLVVWWELMAVAATVLVWQSPGAVRAGYRYAVYHQLGGAALAAGVLLHYTRVGSFVFGDGITDGLPLLLALLGVGMNVGFLGVHVWIVDTYPRPSVASTVVLSGFTTKVGAYTLVRLLPGERLVVAYLGGAMVLVGVTLAVLQTDVRRLLSYHVVSQVGYMVAGIGLATAAGRAGGVAHLVNNVLYKTLLFMIAGAIVVETGRESLKEVGGLGRRMRRTAAAFAVAALAITGVPGFAGFVSKGFVTTAVDAAGAEPLWWALQVGAVGTVVSFVKFGYYAFVRAAPADATAGEGEGTGAGPADDSIERTADGSDVDPGDGMGGGTDDASDEPDDRTDDASDEPVGSTGVGPAVTVAFALLAVPCVGFGVAPGLFASGLPAGVSTSSVFSTAKLTDAAVITVAGVGAFALLKRPLARVTAVPDLDALYHPAGAFLLDAGSRAVSVAGGAAERTAARAVAAVTAAVSAPDALDRVGIPRTTIGTGVLLLALVVVLGLVTLLWPG